MPLLPHGYVEAVACELNDTIHHNNLEDPRNLTSSRPQYFMSMLVHDNLQLNLLF